MGWIKVWCNRLETSQRGDFALDSTLHLERYVDVNIKKRSEYEVRARRVAASPASKEINNLKIVG